MALILRKIGFYTLKLKRKRKEEHLNPSVLDEVFSHLDTLQEDKRVKDASTSQSKKFHFLRKQSRTGNIQKLLFSSAKYNHRPPLIDKDTAQRRSNPKLLTEGEEERTHIAFKYNADEIVAIIEEHRAGISISGVVDYLSNFADAFYEQQERKRSWKWEVGVIPKNDFLGEMERLERVSLGEVHTESRLLGSEFLDYSNRTESVKNDLVLSIKSRPNESIVDTIKDIYNKFTGESSEIQKIRVKGLTDVGTEVVLDTDIIRMIHHLDAEVNEEDGVIVSKEFLTQLAEIVTEY